MSDIRSTGTRPRRARNRHGDTARTCSACALLSIARPVSDVGNSAWNGNTRATFEVSGTTVTVPRPVYSAAIWYLVDNNGGAPKESFWLIITGLLILSFPLASASYTIRSHDSADRYSRSVRAK